MGIVCSVFVSDLLVRLNKKTLRFKHEPCLRTRVPGARSVEARFPVNSLNPVYGCLNIFIRLVVSEQLLFFVFGGFCQVVSAIFLLETFDSSCGIDIFLLTGIERVAHRAYLGVDLLGCTASLEGIATAATHLYGMIFRMYAFFHFTFLQNKRIRVYYIDLKCDCNINFQIFGKGGNIVSQGHFRNILTSRHFNVIMLTER